MSEVDSAAYASLLRRLFKDIELDIKIPELRTWNDVQNALQNALQIIRESRRKLYEPKKKSKKE
jgi:hypothetical protein